MKAHEQARDRYRAHVGLTEHGRTRAQSSIEIPELLKRIVGVNFEANRMIYRKNGRKGRRERGRGVSECV